MRIVYFGTPAFAVPSLNALLAAGHEVATVVTQPDRRRGRGQRTSPSPVKVAATAAGLPVLQPERVRGPEFLEALEATASDLGVVAAYGRILPDSVLATPAHGTINVHASLLPQYRGAAPIHRAVIAGEKETGITMIRLVAEMDAGPMLGKARLPIGADQTSAELEQALAEVGASLLVETVRQFELGTVREEPQDHSQATFAPRLSRDDGRMEWARPARRLHDQVRGLHPWPHAFAYLGERRLMLLRTEVLDASGPGAEPGTVIEARGDRLHVQCGASTTLAIRSLKPEGRAAMETRAFLAGRPIQPPARFGPDPTR